MKKIILIIAIMLASIVGQAQDIGGNHYVAHPDSTYSGMNPASDLNDGSYANPWATWQHALENTLPGETTYFRGGVWTPTSTTFQSSILLIDPQARYEWNNPRGHVGTVDFPIQFLNYPGETPVLDCHLIPNYGNFLGGLSLANAHYTTFRGLEIKNIYQYNGEVSVNGFSTDLCSNMTFENMNIHDIGGRGAWITSVVGVYGHMQDSASYQLFDATLYTLIDTVHEVYTDTTRIINCDFWNCADSLAENPFNMGDGIKGDLEAGGVFIIEGTRFWNCSDDGVDLSGAGQKILNNCWAFDIGVNFSTLGFVDDGNGFKLGGVRDSITVPNFIMSNCISANTYRFAMHLLDYDPYYRNNARIYNSIFYNAGYGPWSFDNVDKFFSSDAYYNCISFGHSGVLAHYEFQNPVITCTWEWSAGSNFANDLGLVDASDFVSLDISQLASPRQADGSLPNVSTFQLTPTSDLIDAGTNVGLSYAGLAPDIGVFEYGLSSTLLTAAFSIDRNPYYTAQVITFNASASTGDIVSYEWFFGDGSTATTAVPSSTHTYNYNFFPAKTNTYNVQLVITDNQSNTDTITQQLELYANRTLQYAPLINFNHYVRDTLVYDLYTNSNFINPTYDWSLLLAQGGTLIEGGGINDSITKVIHYQPTTLGSTYVTGTDIYGNTEQAWTRPTTNILPLPGIVDSASLVAALATALPGDTLRLESNTFTGNFDIYPNGEDGNLITIMAANGYNPVFTGNVTVTGDYLNFDFITFSNTVNLTGPDGLTIQGCTFNDPVTAMVITFPPFDYTLSRWSIQGNTYQSNAKIEYDGIRYTWGDMRIKVSTFEP